MTHAQPLSQSLKRISIGLAALIMVVAMVALAAIWLQRQEIDQFRQEVGRSLDIVSTLTLEIADAQNALIMADSTDTQGWAKRAEDSLAVVKTSMEDLDEVAALTRVPATTDAAIRSLDTWLSGGKAVLSGDGSATSVDTLGYSRARAALAGVGSELTQVRADRRFRLDATILGSAISILIVTVFALGGVFMMVRHQIRRLTRPLNQLQKMVAARVAGDSMVRASTDQGFFEAVHLAKAINQLSDSNNALRTTQDATIRSHQLAELVAGHLAAAEGQGRWVSALEALRDGLALDAVAIVASDETVGHLPRFAPADGEQAWIEDSSGTPCRDVSGCTDAVVIVPVELGGLPMGTLFAKRDRGGWSASDAEALEMCSHHLAASLALESVIETIRRLDADKTRFLATTSHELRTPLTAVVAWLSMLQDGDLGKLTDEQEHAMEVVERNVARLRDLIEDLLTVNQLDSGQARAVRTRLDVGALSCRVVESLTPMAKAAGVELSCEVQESNDSGHATGDPGQIERAIVNITQNALKFTPRGGRVELVTQSDERGVTLSCTDTGMGIPASDLPHVLERFRRAENVHGLPGTGLGLSIVDSIMEAHGGSFRLKSEEGAGTTAILTMPLMMSTHTV